MSNQGHPRILIVRLSAIGDVIHGIPVLNALRQNFPKAHLSWAVEGRPAEILREHSALDEVVALPRGWLKSPRQVWRLRRRLREIKPNIAIDLQCLARSAIVAWLSGASKRIGFAGVDGREMSRWFHTHLVQASAVHVIERNLELLRPLGIPSAKPQFAMPEFSQACQSLDESLANVAVANPFVVLNPGAGWPSKLWEMDRFAEVAHHIGKNHGLTSLVVHAGDKEKSMAETIVQKSHGHAKLAPNTSLAELAALVKRACIFISADTGPLHLAAAMGTPCVGLFGPVSVLRNGPYGPQHVGLQKLRLHGSSRKRRNASNETMRAITTDDVIQACEKILSSSQSHRKIA